MTGTTYTGTVHLLKQMELRKGDGTTESFIVPLCMHNPYKVVLTMSEDTVSCKKCMAAVVRDGKLRIGPNEL